MLSRIVVQEKGQIVEMGTNQELSAAINLYETLWRRQSGGFIGNNAYDEQPDLLNH